MTPKQTLETLGLLLLADNHRPALAQLIVGGPIPGSWWGHKKGKAIFAAATELEDDADVATAKLVDGKVTFIHRRLWPALIAVGNEGAAWQIDGLSEAAEELVAEVRARGAIASDHREPDGKARMAAFGAVADRLLCATRDAHTTTGAHSTIAESWERWAARRGVVALDDIEAARAQLSAAITALGGGTPPWDRRRHAAPESARRPRDP